jgi:membrane protein
VTRGVGERHTAGKRCAGCAVSSPMETPVPVTVEPVVERKRALKRALARIPGGLTLARLVAETVRICLRYRVTGLASEAGFFALLSFPPLVLGLFGGVGYLGNWIGDVTIDSFIQQIQTYAGKFLTQDIIDDLLLPTVHDVFRAGRGDLISIGFLLSLWSGSRALNVFVDTISIMYGQSGVRGIVRTRALSFSLYFATLMVGVVVIPLLLIGPTLLGRMLPDRLQVLVALYWPVVTVLVVATLTTLYHIATPRRTPWVRNLPGAALTLILWAVTSYVVRGTIAASLGGSSIFGPLSTPIVLLIWLYFVAISVLIGAAFNAATLNLRPAEREVVTLRERIRRPLTPFPEGSDDTADEEASIPSPRFGEAVADRLRSLSARTRVPEAPHADVAQLVERNLAKVEVAGSRPVIRSEG